MNLVACEAPAGALDNAPQSGLKHDSPTESWSGFWGADDRYYARCTTPDGMATWYRLVDETPDKSELNHSATPVAAVPTGSARLLLLYRVGPSASHGCMIGVRHASRRLVSKSPTSSTSTTSPTSTGRADRVRSADMRA
jgi:hypothetical protein